MPLDTALLGKFARLYLARKKLREKDAELTKRLTEMEQPLIDHMRDQGDDAVEQISLKGGRTLVLNTTIWAKVLVDDKKPLIEALQALDLGYMTSAGVNHQSLSSYLRGLEAEGEELPAELRGLVKANPVDKLTAKRL